MTENSPIINTPSFDGYLNFQTHLEPRGSGSLCIYCSVTFMILLVSLNSFLKETPKLIQFLPERNFIELLSNE